MRAAQCCREACSGTLLYIILFIAVGVGTPSRARAQVCNLAALTQCQREANDIVCIRGDDPPICWTNKQKQHDLCFRNYGCTSGICCPGDVCRDLANDISNCGACRHACTAVPNGIAVCTAGQCGVTCQAGYKSCSDGSCRLGGCPAVCGDHLCSAPEDHSTCPQDCPAPPPHCDSFRLQTGGSDSWPLLGNVNVMNCKIDFFFHDSCKAIAADGHCYSWSNVVWQLPRSATRCGGDLTRCPR
jgi:hypothetical protein